MASVEGASIAGIRGLIPEECFAIEPARSWGGLATAVMRLAIGLALLTWIEPSWGVDLVLQLPALAAAWLFVGWSITGLFVIGHDCGHMAFSERRWVNEAVGHVCLALAFTGFHNWRIWHNHHHAKTQLRGQDPDWPERMMTRAEYERSPLADRMRVRLGFGTPLGLLAGFWVGVFRRTFMGTLAPQIPLTRGARRDLFLSSTFTIIVCGSLSWWLVHVGGAWALVKYYWMPAFIAAVHGAMLTYLHHTSADSLVFDRDGWTPFRGQVVSTFNVRFPRWLEAMWFDINIHLPHHLAPRIPWYHLLETAEAIRAARADWYQERRFSLSYLRDAWARPLLSRAAGGAYYEMAGFDADERRSSG
ncbi:fatty acid desaturase [Sorangium sp. So ce1036]|uniref:fatty acid desaturase family protein n=1 Tax=Sorangium sp. So ce1036 TaxID=3133328 RepID=UPI003EFF0114